MNETGPIGSHRTASWLLSLAGAAVSFGGAVTYFTVFARFPALRDVPWVSLPVTAGGVALAGWGVWRSFRGGGLAARCGAVVGLALAVLFAAAFAGYVFWLSYQVPPPTETAASMVVAPDVTLTAPDGSPVRIGDFRGRKLVVVFYRGFW